MMPWSSCCLVQVWDLRKLKDFKRFDVGTAAPSLPLAVRFDVSGLFLAVGGDQAQVIGVKQEWAALANMAGALGNKARLFFPFPDHLGPAAVCAAVVMCS